MSGLKFLLDENVPKSVKTFLEHEGVPAEYGPKGVRNTEIISLSREKRSVLITRDSDFLDRLLYPPREFSGIIVFRIHPPIPEKLVNALSLLLQEVKEFKGKLFVVEEDGFEIMED